ncbi:MAG: alpha/beta hydrolase, partial [Myxococcales bacterium]|nr:alpha/beta hydrolase [Myxococcales bacterium]
MSVSFLFVLLSACSDGPSLPAIDVPVRPVDATPDPEPPAPEPPAPEPPVTPPPEPPGGLDVADLAAVVLDGGPAFTRVRSFQPGDAVSAAWSGAACDAWVTPDRDWTLGDPLVDVRGAPTPLAVQPGRPVVPVAPADDLPVQGAGSAFDLVLDCDHDGTLSAGDTVDGFAEPGFHVLPDLTPPGPHTVVQQGHGQGFTQQLTYWPADIANLGQVPVVVVAHGYGHQLDYYAHLGEHLASWGYVVTSFRNDVGNGDGPGTRTASTTLLSNTEHLLANASTLVGGALDGHLDADRIVWIGHSTGGECVVRAYTRLHDGQYTSPWFDADSIALISSMAPVAWLPPSQSNPYDVPYHLITGGADRDTGNYPEPGYTRN